MSVTIYKIMTVTNCIILTKWHKQLNKHSLISSSVNVSTSDSYHGLVDSNDDRLLHDSTDVCLEVTNPG